MQQCTSQGRFDIVTLSLKRMHDAGMAPYRPRTLWGKGVLREVQNSIRQSGPPPMEQETAGKQKSSDGVTGPAGKQAPKCEAPRQQDSKDSSHRPGPKGQQKPQDEVPGTQGQKTPKKGGH